MPPEKLPRGLAAGDHRRRVLAEAQGQLTVPGVDGGEDQRMHHPAVPGRRIGQQAHLAEDRPGTRRPKVHDR